MCSPSNYNNITTTLIQLPPTGVRLIKKNTTLGIVLIQGAYTLYHSTKKVQCYSFGCKGWISEITVEGAKHAPDKWLRLRVVNHQSYINIIHQSIKSSVLLLAAIIHHSATSGWRFVGDSRLLNINITHTRVRAFSSVRVNSVEGRTSSASVIFFRFLVLTIFDAC